MTAHPKLAILRDDIDSVDRQILELLRDRVKLVLRVGEYKRENDLKVYDPERERLLMTRLIEIAEPPLDKRLVQNVYERIIDESRRIEQHHVE